MKSRIKSLVMSSLVVMLLAVFGLPALAQHPEMLHVGRKGLVKLNSDVRVGDVLLKSGEYQVQHKIEGEDHIISFKKLLLIPAGRVQIGSPGKEVARIKCRLETLDQKVKRTGLSFGTNSSGERTIQEVYVRAENVKHVF